MNIQTNNIIDAIRVNDIDLALSKIESGCPINVEDEGWSALHWAAQSGSTQLVDALLRKGAIVDASDESGITSLAVAVGENNLEITKLLLKYGADPNRSISAYDEGQVIHLSCSFGYIEMTRLLLTFSGVSLYTKDKSGKTGLDYAKDSEINDFLK